MPGNDCLELTKKTADAIDDDSLRELFVSTQMNNLDLCCKAAIEWVSHSISCQFANVDNLKKCLGSTKAPIRFSICGDSQQISTLLGI